MCSPCISIICNIITSQRVLTELSLCDDIRKMKNEAHEHVRAVHEVEEKELQQFKGEKEAIWDIVTGERSTTSMG